MRWIEFATVPKIALSNIAGPLEYQLYLWEPGRLGIAYKWSDGYGEAGPVGPEDWPQIRRLEAAGKLSYRTEAARALHRKFEQPPLDR
jgi:hypothetical protein